MSSADALLGEIDAFLQRTGITQTQFGQKCMNNGSFIRQLRNGSGVTLRTLDKVRSFMAEWDDNDRRRQKRRAEARAA
jgi:hypothetical protein